MTKKFTTLLSLQPGILRLPQLPDIRGLDFGFTGTKFHSADWPDNLDLSGKRVGIIGTGSTSCQIVGEITEKVGTMHVFQRTPHWVAPLPQKKYASWQKFLMRALPFLPKGNLLDQLSEIPRYICAGYKRPKPILAEDSIRPAATISMKKLPIRTCGRN